MILGADDVVTTRYRASDHVFPPSDVDAISATCANACAVSLGTKTFVKRSPLDDGRAKRAPIQ